MLDNALLKVEFELNDAYTLILWEEASRLFQAILS